MDPVQERYRRRVLALAEATGLSLTELARAAGLAPSTLTRFVNSARHKFTLSGRTLAKIEGAAAQRGAPAGMAEPQGWQPPPAPEITDAEFAQLQAAIAAAAQEAHLPTAPEDLAMLTRRAERALRPLPRHVPFDLRITQVVDETINQARARWRASLSEGSA